MVQFWLYTRLHKKCRAVQVQQSDLWHDTIYEALAATVAAAGGPKRVAPKIWPAMDQTSAITRLRTSIDPNHAQKLCLEELILLGKLGRDVGDNSLMAFLARELGCEVKPLAPAEAKKKAKKARVSVLLAEFARLLEDE